MRRAKGRPAGAWSTRLRIDDRADLGEFAQNHPGRVEQFSLGAANLLSRDQIHQVLRRRPDTGSRNSLAAGHALTHTGQDG